jgi:Spy/CpxP family protein refolding chaperone
MRIEYAARVLSLMLAVAAPAAAADAPAPNPGTPGGAGRVFEELADELRALGRRWPGYFQEAGPFPERPVISIMLSQRQELGLTTAQVNELEQLRADFEREAIKRDAELRVAELDIAMLLKSDPVDLGKVEAKVREIERTRADLRIARIRAIEQARARLTPEQRAKLADLLADPRFAFPRWRTPPAPPMPPPPHRF